ncbi:MAG: glycosyltransferase family 2 protein [Clostridiales bacterium]|nr:glycosyltransferase family 2 protein [Clostridiales bacterium]
MPEITVVMPVYNTPALFLREAVESVLKQSFSDFEFLIVDDGSRNSDTLEYLESISDPRVHVIRNSENLGCTKSLNVGLRAASGKYIARMDADDVSMPERFAKQYDFMENHPDVIGCGSRVTHNLNDTTPSKMKSDSMELFRIKLLFVNAGPHHPTAFFRREVLVQNHIEYNEELRYAQDYDLWMRLSRIGESYILPDRLLYYRKHAGRSSQAHREEQIRCDKVTQKKLLLELLDDVTEEEQDLHYLYSTGYYRGLKLTKEVRCWYRKLIRANDKKHIYPRLLFRKRVYWILLRVIVKSRK